MDHMEAKIGNSKQPLFDGTDTDRVNYSAFGETVNADENMLPFGEYIQDHKQAEVNKACIEVLDNYSGSKLFALGKYSIPVLAQLKLREWDDSGNIIGE